MTATGASWSSPVKAKLMLADAARVHPDGTISILRGGIANSIVSRGQPPVFRGSIAVTLIVELGERGNHSVRIACCDEDGVEQFAIDGGFQAAPTHFSTVHVAFDVSHRFAKFGRYTFVVSVDGHQLDTWPLTIVEADDASRQNPAELEEHDPESPADA